MIEHPVLTAQLIIEYTCANLTGIFRSTIDIHGGDVDEILENELFYLATRVGYTILGATVTYC